MDAIFFVDHQFLRRYQMKTHRSYAIRKRNIGRFQIFLFHKQVLKRILMQHSVEIYEGHEEELTCNLKIDTCVSTTRTGKI